MTSKQTQKLLLPNDIIHKRNTSLNVFQRKSLDSSQELYTKKNKKYKEDDIHS